MDIDDKVDEVVVSYQQIPSPGTYIMLYEPKLNRIKSFRRYGRLWLYGGRRLDGDGRRDILHSRHQQRCELVQRVRRYSHHAMDR